MKKRPCHLCGSTHWPSDTTTCPLCFGEPDPEPDYDEEADIDLVWKIHEIDDE